ncbi:hypothetical protein BLA29_000829, partial [Euroglyphus maynei]
MNNGIEVKSTKRIVGGERVPIDEVPWQALLHQRISSSKTIQCGAVIIGTVWVLSAAHCIRQPLEQYPIDVYFGVSNISTTNIRQSCLYPIYA